VVGPVNPVPVIVTVLPPKAGPEVGDKEVIVGMVVPPAQIERYRKVESFSASGCRTLAVGYGYLQ
jgi:hypothetical protein